MMCVLRMLWKKKQKRIYLDHAAATPVHADVHAAMQPYFSEIYGNPGAIHSEGVYAKRAIEQARGDIARTLRVRAEQVTFTASGTEANNLALYGFLTALLETDIYSSLEEMEVITTPIEHPSILRVLEDLQSQGLTVQYTKMTEEGRIDIPQFASLLNEKTVLVTCAYANSEIGVVEDVKHVTRTVRKYNTAHGSAVKTHLDASQAPLWLPCQLDALGVDMMTLDAGKCYGPKGVGVLVHLHSVVLKAHILGGGQENSLRAGTENTALIVGCAKALEIAQAHWKDRSEAVATLRDNFITTLLTIDGVLLNGSREQRLANNIHISIPGIDTEFTVVVLDAAGIACSTRSACSGVGAGVSHVVYEITKDTERAQSTIRFSLGEHTKSADLESAYTALAEHIEKTRVFQSTLAG